MVSNLIKVSLLISYIMLGNQARADIIDRVNDCESANGGNGCVYDNLRELGRGSCSRSDEIISYCDCVYIPSSPNSSGTCYGSYTYSVLNVTVENVTKNTQNTRRLDCYPGESGYQRCQEALSSHQRCRQR